MIAVRRMVLVAAVAAAWLISVGSASAADGSYLYLRGEQGDYLVGESTRWYTNADAQFFSEYGCTGCSPTSPLQVSLRTPEDVTWAVAMAARTGEIVRGCSRHNEEFLGVDADFLHHRNDIRTDGADHDVDIVAADEFLRHLTADLGLETRHVDVLDRLQRNPAVPSAVPKIIGGRAE